ncbi:chaperone modulator CbpM [Sphingobium sp. TCM1]|uniref:chaperone modulator CbpM n=1 Tax=Sphingobium sp. TCM1 TaxID=453246 RepID=UPI00083732AB|nr:chaperone modulator CbpM [Sphingobium sp. TCM1]
MIDLEDFLTRSGIEFRSLEQWIEREWLFVERRSTTIFLSEMDAARARLIHDLKRDFGVNDDGVDIILHLVDQLHGLRQAFLQIQADMNLGRRRDSRRSRARKSGPIRNPRRKL